MGLQNNEREVIMANLGLDDIKLFKNKFINEDTVNGYLNEGKAHITKDDWAQLLYTCLQANKLTEAVKDLKKTRYSILHCTSNANKTTTRIPASSLKQLFPDADSEYDEVPFEKGLTVLCPNGNVFVTTGYTTVSEIPYV